jgi:hypothetical protein
VNSDPNSTNALFRLPDADRARLGGAMQELLAHGSILGLEPGSAELYAWCRQNFDWLREAAALVGLSVHNEHESRLIQALPERPSLRLNLRQDATLVLLALWYEFDTQVREQGATQVVLTVEQLNQLLKEKLLPDLKSQPPPGRMREILRHAQRFNLVRLAYAEPFEQSRIEVLSTLKKVIPFHGIEEWTKTADLHRQPENAAGDASDVDEEGDAAP